MDWMLVITMIIEALMECFENRSRADIEAGLRKPGIAENLILRRILRKEFGLRGTELRNAVQDAVMFAKVMPQMVMDDLLDEAQEQPATA